jgi:hypothetical protein
LLTAPPSTDPSPIKPVKLSEHVKAYLAHTEKANRTSYKDASVLDRLLESIGDRLLSEISAFHIERWKTHRAAAVSKSTVNPRSSADLQFLS